MENWRRRLRRFIGRCTERLNCLRGCRSAQEHEDVELEEMENQLQRYPNAYSAPFAPMMYSRKIGIWPQKVNIGPQAPLQLAYVPAANEPLSRHNVVKQIFESIYFIRKLVQKEFITSRIVEKIRASRIADVIKHSLERQVGDIHRKNSEIVQQSEEIEARAYDDSTSYAQLRQDAIDAERNRKVVEMMAFDIKIVDATIYALQCRRQAEQFFANVRSAWIQPVAHLIVHHSEYVGLFRELNEKIEAFLTLAIKLKEEFNTVVYTLRNCPPFPKQDEFITKLERIMEAVERNITLVKSYRNIPFEYGQLDNMIAIKESLLNTLVAMADIYRYRVTIGMMDIKRKQWYTDDTLLVNFGLQSPRTGENVMDEWKDVMNMRDKYMRDMETAMDYRAAKPSVNRPPESDSQVNAVVRETIHYLLSESENQEE